MRGGHRSSARAGSVPWRALVLPGHRHAVKELVGTLAPSSEIAVGEGQENPAVPASLWNTMGQPCPNPLPWRAVSLYCPLSCERGCQTMEPFLGDVSGCISCLFVFLWPVKHFHIFWEQFGPYSLSCFQSCFNYSCCPCWKLKVLVTMSPGAASFGPVQLVSLYQGDQPPC